MQRQRPEWEVGEELRVCPSEVGLLMRGAATRLLVVNGRHCRMDRWTNENVFLRGFFDFLHLDNWNFWICGFSKILGFPCRMTSRG